MDKKILVNEMESIVVQIADKHNLTEGEARALVVITLKQNRDAFISAVQTPKLVLQQA